MEPTIQQPIAQSPVIQPIVQNTYVNPSMDANNGLNLAEPFIRMGSYFIDCLIFGIPLAIILAILHLILVTPVVRAYGSTGFSTYYDTSSFFSAGAIAYTFISFILSFSTIIFAYVIIPTYIFKGKTLAMKLLGLKFVTEQGADVNVKDLVMRSSIQLGASVVSTIPCIGILSGCVLFIVFLVNLYLLFTDPKRQIVYDKIAKTLVVMG